MATYNGERYLREQILSIIPQLLPDDEIIISDDNSSDKTIDVIKSIGSPLIHIIYNDKARGYASNFENALNHAHGDYIFLSDQDDVWMPNKVEVALKALENFDLCVSDCELIDSDGKLICSSFFELNHSKPGFFKNLYKNSYLGCCMAFRRNVLSYILPFPPNVTMHDVWMGVCVELFGTSLFIDKKLVRYRRHGNNVSPTSGKSEFSLSYKMKYRLGIIWQLLKRKFK